MQFLKKFDKIYYKLRKDHISEYAAECAYYTILSFIPFIILLLTLIQYTNIDQETLFFSVREVFPTAMQDMILGIIQEVYSKSVGTISIAAIVVLWSAGKGFYALCKGLRTIYETEEQKPNFIMRIEGTFYTLVFIIAIILFLVIIVFGNRINNLISQKFVSIGLIISFILKIRIFIFLLAMFFLFLMIYSFVPKHRLSIKKQILGAVFASVAWYIISWLFSIYVDLFAGFSNTYGSLTSIILVMMWVYVCMYTILIGAEINIIFNKISSSGKNI